MRLIIEHEGERHDVVEDVRDYDLSKIGDCADLAQQIRYVVDRIETAEAMADDPPPEETVYDRVLAKRAKLGLPLSGL